MSKRQRPTFKATFVFRDQRWRYLTLTKKGHTYHIYQPSHTYNPVFSHKRLNNRALAERLNKRSDP